MLQRILVLVKSNQFLMKLVTVFFKVLANNKVNRKTSLKCGGGVRIRRTVVIDKGQNNEIVIGDLSRIYNCSFNIKGEDSKVLIGNHVLLQNVEIHIEDDGNEILIGDGCNLTGKAHIACTEGKRIEIGRECLFSNEIVIRTGDSHSILNEEGIRINQAENVVIGNRVWVGQRCILLKGCNIGDDSVLATGCIVTKGNYTSKSILAGVPAKTVKTGIAWKMERI